MRLIKSYILILFVSLAIRVVAQQIPQYSQWYLHQFANNPAHAGIKKCVDIHSLFRSQWVGIEGAPKSGFLSVSIPINLNRKQYLSARHGTGFKFETDRIGQFSVNRLNVAYAAHFNFDEDKRLSLGLYGGIMQMGYDPSTVHTASPDPVVMNEGSFVSPDATFGAWFNDVNYYAGVVVQNLFPSPWKNIGTNSRNRFHTSLHGGYRLSLTDRFTLLPAANVKIPPRGPVAFDLNLHLDFNNTLGIGLGYRNTDALIALLSIKIKEQFAIVYSFDYTLSEIQLGAHNTHEISLQFTTCKRRKSSASSCPLFE